MDNLERLRVFHAVAQAEKLHQSGRFATPHAVWHQQTHQGHGRRARGAALRSLGKKISADPGRGDSVRSGARRHASVASAEQRIHELDGLDRGRLRVGASFPVGLYVLPRLLAAYRKDHPAIEVTLAISTTASIEAKVLDNKLDFGLVSADVHHPNLLTWRS